MNSLKYKFGKIMANRPEKQLRVVGGVIGTIVALVVLFGLFSCNKTAIWKTIGSFFSPVPMYGEEISCVGTRYMYFIFYLIGTIIISGVIIAIFTNIIRTAGERYRNGTARYKFEDHTLFLGYDELMIGTLKKMLDDSNDIVVAVPDKVEQVRNDIYQHLTKEQSECVIVVKTLRINEEELRECAGVTTAKRIFIIGQPEEKTHDANNLKCLGQVAALCRCSAKTDRMCIYYLRNQSTFYLLHRLSYKAADFKEVIDDAGLQYDEVSVDRFVKAAEPFNFHESIARHVLIGDLTDGGEDCISLNAAEGNPHLVIYGMTQMGVALMRDALMTQHFPGRRLRITMVDENAQEEMHYLIGRHRPFFENCHYVFRNMLNPLQNLNQDAKLDFLDVDMEFIQCDVAHPMMTDYLRECVINDGKALSVAICTNDAPQNMALALYLPSQLLENDIPVWVFQNDDNSMNSFVENGNSLSDNRYKNVHIFSTTHFSLNDRRKSMQWLLAKAVSDDYARRHPEYSLPEWLLRHQWDRWSSLYGAVSKLPMLKSVGKINLPIVLNDTEKESLAMAEHCRWNTEKLLNGWEPAPNGMKTLFQHNLIVPYDALDEKYKDEDRKQIDVVVKILNEMTIIK